MNLHVVLFEPEIPQNTGNIARTCAATGASLHLIEPLGFSIADKYLKRAGLDYWHLVKVKTYASLDAYSYAFPVQRKVYATKKTGVIYTSYSYPDNCSLIFGKETAGLSEELLRRYQSDCVRIPMRSQARSLNLSNAAALLVYEALRQHGYPNLARQGPGL